MIDNQKFTLIHNQLLSALYDMPAVTFTTWLVIVIVIVSLSIVI